MIFFDLEFYVPRADRNLPETKGTLVFNPTVHQHIILGGHFISTELTTLEVRKSANFWLWDYNNDEKMMLDKIYEYFEEEWEYQQNLNQKVGKNRIKDIVTCGIGVSRVDLPSLFIRSKQFDVGIPRKLFTLYFKARTIDLSNVASLLFRDLKVLYPKSANEIVKILHIKGKKKPSGKNVWEMYDIGDFDAISNRCESEVESIIEIYRTLLNRNNAAENE